MTYLLPKPKLRSNFRHHLLCVPAQIAVLHIADRLLNCRYFFRIEFGRIGDVHRHPPPKYHRATAITPTNRWRSWWGLPHFDYFFGVSTTFGATKPGVALKLETTLPSVFQTRTSPFAAPPATNWPSGLMATA